MAVAFLKWYFLGKIAKGAFRVFMMGGMPGMGGFRNDNGRPDSQFENSERDVVEIQPNKIEHKEK